MVLAHIVDDRRIASSPAGRIRISFLTTIETRTNPITVSIDDCALNNTMCDPFWACSVSGNKVAVSTVEWSSDSLKDSNLKAENITDISFSMRVYNSESWEDYVEEKISLTTEK